MGGKVWSEGEERVFWTEVVPRSVGAAKAVTPAIGWTECAELMQEKMGKDARRTYTPSMLYEHHYQCINLSTKSPKARNFVNKWKEDRENANGAASRRPAAADSSEGKEDYISLILAHDPSAKRYLQNKGVSRGRDGMENDQVGPRSTLGGGRNEPIPPRGRFVNTSRTASLAHPHDIHQPPPGSSTPMIPPTQYGYEKVGPDAIIGPTLSTSGIAIDQSGSSADDTPELSTSISSDSSLGDSIPEIPTTRRYRTIAPAPLPPIDILHQPMNTNSMYANPGFVSSTPQPQHVGYNSDPRPGKRQFLFDYEDGSPLKRRTLEADTQSHRLLGPRTQPLTHWQRMGFRDEGGRVRAEARGDYNRLPPMSLGGHEAGSQDWSSHQTAQSDHGLDQTDVRRYEEPDDLDGEEENGAGERGQYFGDGSNLGTSDGKRY